MAQHQPIPNDMCNNIEVLPNGGFGVGVSKRIVGNELYVYMGGKLLYKRWLDKGYGMVFPNEGLPFTAKDVEQNKVKNNGENL